MFDCDITPQCLCYSPGGVGIAGVDGDLWSIHGGNKLVPERLLEKTGAKLVKGKVYQVSYHKVL